MKAREEARQAQQDQKEAEYQLEVLKMQKLFERTMYSLYLLVISLISATGGKFLLKKGKNMLIK